MANKIDNYITRGIVEANLNFSKEKRNYFSLVKFEYKVDLTDAFSFKDLISFIHIYTDFSPILRQDKDSFLIFLKDTKIHQAKAIINKLALECKIKFGIDLENIGITLSSYKDTYKSIIDRVDKYFVMSKLSSSKKIFYGTVDFDYYDTMNPLKILQDIFIKSSNINLHNLYEGVPIKETVRVIGFNSGIIQAKIKPDKTSFYEKEKFTFIQHDLIPDIIKADILKIDTSRFLIILGNLKFLKSSPVERSSIRIQPDKRVHAILTKGHKKLIEGNIVSISKDSISLEVLPKQVKISSLKSMTYSELNIKFFLLNDKNFLSPVKIKAHIINIINNNIILNISPNTIEKTKIKGYISLQQTRLLSTLRQKLKK